MKRASQAASRSNRPTKSARKENHGSHDTQVHASPSAAVQTESESVRQRAKPYLLATAKMPVRVLNAEWSVGVNRPLDQQHVAALQSSFARSLERTCPAHFMAAECSAQAVQHMWKYLESQGVPMMIEGFEDLGGDGEQVQSFLDWDQVNGDEHPELGAGNHRKAALLRLGLGAEEQWWTCELYDKGM